VQEVREEDAGVAIMKWVGREAGREGGGLMRGSGGEEWQG